MIYKPYEDIEDVPLHECPKCGHEWHEPYEVSLEDTDADGNRGRYMGTVVCPECDEEISWWI